jgi:uncharacterized membrane protein (UPF0127 family)
MRPRELKTIVNLTRESVVCEQVVIADRALPRMRGLLGRWALPSGEGLLLRPAPSIHTAFLRFPIDVVFLDSDLRVIRLVQRLMPWRAASALRAKAVLELSAGESARRELRLRDQLAVVEPAHKPAASELSAPSDAPVGASARVLLVGNDRRFRAVASALLTQRAYSVAVGDCSEDVTELASRQGAEVVVIDATASLTALARDVARLKALRPRVGVVAVSSDPQEGIDALPVISKWSSFDAVFEAIEKARPDNRRSGAAGGPR